MLGAWDAVGLGNSNKDDWVDDGEMSCCFSKPLFFSDMSFPAFSISEVFQDVVRVAADATDAPPPLEATCDV